MIYDVWSYKVAQSPGGEIATKALEFEKRIVRILNKTMPDANAQLVWHMFHNNPSARRIVMTFEDMGTRMDQFPKHREVEEWKQLVEEIRAFAKQVGVQIFSDLAHNFYSIMDVES